MSLRLKMQLIVGGLVLLLVCAIIRVQFNAMRESVNEEVVAANRVAAQLLNRTAWLYAAQGTPAMREFLAGVGRVRSNDIVLLDHDGRTLYESPPSPYKAGRDAPGWFASLITPETTAQEIEFADGKLVVRSNASRAVLDAWDEVSKLALFGLAALVAVNVLVFWLVGRTVRPFADIVRALNRLEGGDFDAALPPLPGQEANALGTAFNRMVRVLKHQVEVEQRAQRAERELSDNRELARWVDQHVEQERRMIARELHDEFGQSVTAIRSMALSIAQRARTDDPHVGEAARTIADEASRLYEAMHGLIPRLAPLALDQFGLPDALADLLARTRQAHHGLQIESHIELAGTPLSSEAALALYRTTQEGITNALRHGHAQRLALSLRADAQHVHFELIDDGDGLVHDTPRRSGGYGLGWLKERIETLGGTLRIEPATPRGARLCAQLPREAA